MLSLNKVLLIGNLVDDPAELRTTNTGSTVTDFRMAVNDRFSSGGEQRERTLFIDVTVWGRTAENVTRFLGKGRGVLVEGRLEQDTWEDRDTGKPRSKIRVVAQQVTFMPRSGEGSGGGGGDRDDGGYDRGRYERTPRSDNRGYDRDRGGDRGGDRGAPPRGGGSGGSDDAGAASPLKDYGLDDEVPF